MFSIWTNLQKKIETYLVEGRNHHPPAVAVPSASRVQLNRSHRSPSEDELELTPPKRVRPTSKTPEAETFYCRTVSQAIQERKEVRRAPARCRLSTQFSGRRSRLLRWNAPAWYPRDGSCASVCARSRNVCPVRSRPCGIRTEACSCIARVQRSFSVLGFRRPSEPSRTRGELLWSIKHVYGYVVERLYRMYDETFSRGESRLRGGA